jgi:FkbM family methyltransferase
MFFASRDLRAGDVVARVLRPIVAWAYGLKRRYGLGERFLARHPTLTHSLMSLLRPVKQSSVIDVHGHVINVDDDDYLGLTITRIYEPDVTRFFQAHVLTGQVAVDVGANIGYFTLLFARLVGPSGRVIAFEPHAGNFRLLESNVAANGYANVELRQQAVGDRTGSAPLYLSSVNPGDHRLVGRGGGESLTVDVVALDHKLPELRGKLDWVKIDVQGGELDVLNGMRSLIRTSPNLTIVLEFAPIALEEFGAEPGQLLGLLQEAGFDVLAPRWDGRTRRCSIDDLLERVRTGDARHTNLVFARPGSPAARSAVAQSFES